MIVGVPVETYPQEQRVALVPAALPILAKAGMEVVLQKGAGEKAGFPDAAYEAQKAKILADRAEVFSTADAVVMVRGFGSNRESGMSDLERVREGQVILGLLEPLGAPEAASDLAGTGATAFALELLPRSTRAQPMDALTSVATVGGYKAVLMAAETLKKMFPMLITAAGTVTPARVFIVGAGVAGLQAIATARRLGAAVRAYDVRPAVKEEVESLGAKFLEMDLKTEEAEGEGGYAKDLGEDFYRRQREMMAGAVKESDVVITTAAVPGKKAPVLITEEMVSGMEPGSIIVDLAAEGGGNCEVTKPGETIDHKGVSVMGPVNIASLVPYHASMMYSGNITSFLKNLVKEGEVNLNLEDEIIRDSLLTHEGEVKSSRVRDLLGG